MTRHNIVCDSCKMIFGFYYYAYAEPIEEALLEPTKISWLCAECDDGDENKK